MKNHNVNISAKYNAQFFQGYDTLGRNAELPRDLEIQKSEGVIWLQKSRLRRNNPFNLWGGGP